jgi:hypothetical protein
MVRFLAAAETGNLTDISSRERMATEVSQSNFVFFLLFIVPIEEIRNKEIKIP